jgi:phage shock protein PspC (stress-responsive transcriptional regulator)
VKPVHEAVTLPLLFLTVVLAAAWRPGGEPLFVPPSLASLVAAVALFALLVRCGALAPERLLHPTRGMLRNLNGASLIIALMAASAQVVTLALPEEGVPALIGWLVLVSLLLQAFAIGPDRARLLRALLVIFGAAFVIKYIVLAALSARANGRLARAVQLLFEGVTLGTITQRPMHPAEGYLAFAIFAAYLIGVACLPPAAWQMVRAGRKELPA